MMERNQRLAEEKKQQRQQQRLIDEGDRILLEADERERVICLGDHIQQALDRERYGFWQPYHAQA